MSAAFGRFFLPGPTEVLPEILEAQAAPMIGHRGSETERLLEACAGPLRAVFRTSRPVMIATCSATGLMEAAIRNGVRRKVLCLVNGAFSQRFADIAAACGTEAHVAKVELGRTFEPDQVRQLLKESGADAVTMVHSESATGALNPVAEIAAAARETGDDVMVLVDGVTSVGGSPVETDAWGLDFVLTGSQKALALPPGLAFGVASERMIERAKTIRGRGIYLDLVVHEEQIRRNQTPYTPAVSLLFALRAQLLRIEQNGGIEARWLEHERMRQRAERWAGERGAELGVSYLPEPGRRSWTVSCLRLPENPGGSVLARAMKAKGFVIASGYGKLKDSTFRIGHMGDHTVAELEAVLDALNEALRRG